MSLRIGSLDGKPLAFLLERWGLAMGFSHDLPDQQFRYEVLDLGRRIFRVVKRDLRDIVDVLDAEGYEFFDREAALVDPDPECAEIIRQVERAGIFLPISVQAWILEVGSVDLRGTHPGWSKPGYAGEEYDPVVGVQFTDPLMFWVSSEDLIGQREYWRECTEDPVSPETRPFRVNFSPDHIQKANLSGGEPYEVTAGRAVVDSMVFNERSGSSFLGYMLRSVQAGGFPGLKAL